MYELKNPVVQKNKTIEHSASELVGCCCEPAASSGRGGARVQGNCTDRRGEGGQVEKVLQGRRWADLEGAEMGVRNIEKVAGS